MQDKGRSPTVGPSRPRLLQQLGPGLISGASDDDPTAIATYAQAGAGLGYALCWMPLLCFPFMVAVQQISARVGRTTGRGLIAAMRPHYPPLLLRGCVLLLLVANTVAIGADLGAMADALRLLLGGPQFAYVLGFGIACILMQVFMRYSRYVSVLKWATLSLLAYVAAVAFAGVDWAAAWRGLLPRWPRSGAELTTIIAIIGVALSPYLFFWQSAQEAEDQRVHPQRAPLVEAPEQAPGALQRIAIDTWVGMAVAVLVGLAIMLTAAATLHASGQHGIASTAEAAAALRPVAGDFAFALFAAGIIGTGLLAVPVLAGSAAYAVGEALRWRVGLARAPLEAGAFYATIAIAVACGIGFNLAGLTPIQALYWSAVLNGMVAVPVLGITVAVASRRSVMREFVIGPALRGMGWLAVLLIGACIAAMPFL